MAITEYKEHFKTLRREYMFDLRPQSVPKKVPETVKNKIVKSISNSEQKRSSFKYLTNEVGKGKRDSLTAIRQLDSEGITTTITYDKEDMEDLLINHNRKNFEQAFSSVVCQDKSFIQLQNEEFQQHILTGELTPRECSSPKVYHLFSLLKTYLTILQSEYSPVTVEEWTQVVKKANRTSTSSVFSKITYPVYKCAIGSPRLTRLLVQCMNITINNCHILIRWIKIVDIMIEKGKGNVLGKLRTIQLVEGGLQLMMMVLITLRNSKRAETSERLSRFNFGN